MSLKIILESTNGNYRQEVDPEDFTIDSPGNFYISFNSIKPGLQYNLSYKFNNNTEIYIERDISFKDLVNCLDLKISLPITIVSFKEILFPDIQTHLPLSGIENLQEINGASFFYILDNLYNKDKEKALYFAWMYNYKNIQDQYPVYFHDEVFLDSVSFLKFPLDAPPNRDLRFELKSDLNNSDKYILSQIVKPYRECLFNDYLGSDSNYLKYGRVLHGLDINNSVVEKPMDESTILLNKYIYFFKKYYNGEITLDHKYSPSELCNARNEYLVVLPAKRDYEYYIHCSEYNLSDDRINTIIRRIKQYRRNTPYKLIVIPSSNNYNNYKNKRVELSNRDGDNYFWCYIPNPLTYANTLLSSGEETETQLQELDSSDIIQNTAVQALLGQTTNLDRYLKHIHPSKLDVIQETLFKAYVYNFKLRYLGTLAGNLITSNEFTEAIIDMTSQNEIEESYELLTSLQVLALSSKEGATECSKAYEKSKEIAEKITINGGTLEELQAAYINPDSDTFREPDDFNVYTQFLFPIRGNLTDTSVELLTAISSIIQNSEGNNFLESITNILKKWKLNIEEAPSSTTIQGGLTSGLKTNKITLKTSARVTGTILKNLNNIIDLATALDSYLENKDLGTLMSLAAAITTNVTELNKISNTNGLSIRMSDLSNRNNFFRDNFITKNLGSILAITSELIAFHERSSQNDNDAAIAHFGAAIFIALSTVSSGGLSIVCGFMATFCGIAASLWKDTPLEVWLETCSVGNIGLPSNNTVELQKITNAPWANNFEPWGEPQQLAAYHLIPYTPSVTEIWSLYNPEDGNLGSIVISFVIGAIDPNMLYSVELSMNGAYTKENLIKLKRDENFIISYDSKNNNYKCYMFFHTTEWNNYLTRINFRNNNPDLFEQIDKTNNEFTITSTESLTDISAKIYFSRSDFNGHTPFTEINKDYAIVKDELSSSNTIYNQLETFYTVIAHYDLTMDIENNKGLLTGIKDFFGNIFNRKG